MPQPLSRVRPSAPRRGGPGVMLERATLSAYVMGVISCWSHTEVSLGRILAACLHAMYLSLSGAEARRSVLSAAAQTSLSEDHAALFALVMKALKPIRERRNDFAHGIWSIADVLPDALLWEAGDDQLEDFERQQKVGSGIGTEIMVYTSVDLDRDLHDAMAASALAHQFSVIINPKFEHAHADTLTRLLASPLLARASQAQPR
jgi:hypothetical protein